MKKLYLAAAVTLAAATMGQAGSSPVVSGLPVPIASTVFVPREIVIGSIPVFFIVTPPVTPGGQFTFTLRPSSRQ